MLLEAKIQLEIVEPGNSWVDIFCREFLRQMLVMASEKVYVWRIVVGYDDSIVVDPDVAIQPAEYRVG